MKSGPLPEPAQTAYVTDSVMRSHEVRSYTASQMRAYAAEQVAAERERCIAECRAVAAAHQELRGTYQAGREHGADECVRRLEGPNVRVEAPTTAPQT